MVSTGRQERFERLFAVSYEPLLGYAVRRCSCGEDAADVVAETFATAWRRLEQVPEGEPARFWLYATARRVLANQRRGARRRTALHERLVLEADRVFEAATPLDRASTDVAGALRRLSDSDRELLQLTSWEGLTPTQIAEVLGCSPAAARVRLHRARQRLLAHLGAGDPARREGAEQTSGGAPDSTRSFAAPHRPADTTQPTGGHP